MIFHHQGLIQQLWFFGPSKSIWNMGCCHESHLFRGNYWAIRKEMAHSDSQIPSCDLCWKKNSDIAREFLCNCSIIWSQVVLLGQWCVLCWPQDIPRWTQDPGLFSAVCSRVYFKISSWFPARNSWVWWAIQVVAQNKNAKNIKDAKCRVEKHNWQYYPLVI